MRDPTIQRRYVTPAICPGCTRVYLRQMHRLASFVTLLLLLAGAGPVLACVSAGAMTTGESACCRAMHGKCGDMGKQSCCGTQIQSDGQPQIAAKEPPAGNDQFVINRLTAQIVAAPLTVAFSRDVPSADSPPGLLAIKITVLRI
jgi:hypothetical protein